MRGPHDLERDPISSRSGVPARSMGDRGGPNPNCGSLTPGNISMGCMKLNLYNGKIGHGDSTYAGKSPTGGPSEPRGCIGTHCTPLARSLVLLSFSNNGKR